MKSLHDHTPQLAQQHESTGSDALSPNIPILKRSSNAHHNINPLPLVLKARHHERQALLRLLRLPPGDGAHAIAQRVDEPQREPREHAGVREQGEVGALGEDDDAVRAHGADVLLVDYGGALPDDGPVEGHGEGECGAEGADAGGVCVGG